MNKLFSNIFIKSSNILAIQFLRYLIVGGTAAVVDIGIYNLLALGLDFYPIIANTISFIFGLTVNYYMSRDWVFNQKQHNPVIDFILFAIIGVIGLILSNVIIYVLIDMKLLMRTLSFLNEKIAISLAKPISVVIVLFWNFIARKIIVFKD